MIDGAFLRPLLQPQKSQPVTKFVAVINRSITKIVKVLRLMTESVRNITIIPEFRWSDRQLTEDFATFAPHHIVNQQGIEKMLNLNLPPSYPKQPHRVLLTGAAGFLGSHLAEALVGLGQRVIGVDSLVTGSEENLSNLKGNPNFRFIRADIARSLPAEIGEEKFDRIWHLASPASPIGYVKHQVTTLKVNSLSTIDLLELAEKNKARIFVASTSECYGDPLEHPQTESYWGHVNPIGMRSMYDESKRFMEAACMAYHRERGVDTRIVRIFNTYGPRLAVDDGRVVVAFIKQALRGEPMTVQGDGSQTRSLCFVADEIRGFLLLMESPEYHLPVNIGNPEEVTMKELAMEIRDLIGSKSEIMYLPLPPDDPKQRCPNISLAKKLLGWEPAIPRKDGLALTIKYYREKLGIAE